MRPVAETGGPSSCAHPGSGCRWLSGGILIWLAFCVGFVPVLPAHSRILPTHATTSPAHSGCGCCRQPGPGLCRHPAAAPGGAFSARWGHRHHGARHQRTPGTLAGAARGGRQQGRGRGLDRHGRSGPRCARRAHPGRGHRVHPRRQPGGLQKLPYDPIKDFAPVTELVKAPGVLVVNAGLPVKDYAEFLRYLKANPGKLSYATPGTATIGHMWGELFKSTTGTFMLHIPYRGAGPALNDVVGGQVMVYFDQVAASLPHIQSGKLRALAVSWNKRLEVLPNVPTYGELGLNVCNEPSWFGLVAPAGTPKAAIVRVQEAVVRALKEPAVRERLAAQGLFATGTSPEEFGAEIKSEIEKMQRVSAFAKITLD